MSDMMSDMKTFTVRDLDRKPGAILDVCDREGAVQIRRRDGRTYTMRAARTKSPSPASRDEASGLPDFAARRRALFPESIPREQMELADRLLAGE